MSWIALENRKSQSAARIRLKLSLGRSKAGVMRLSVPSAMSGKLKLDGADYAALLLGADEHAGKMKVVPRVTATGFRLGRLKHAVNISFPVPPGVTLKENEAALDYEIETDGFVVTLPEWARPGVYAVKGDAGSAPAADESRPGSLEMSGTDLIMGGARLRLTRSQADAARFLIGSFGKTVRRKDLLDHLRAADPADGMNDNLLDAAMTKLMQRIADSGMAIAIVKRPGGWEMRRPVAG